MRLDSLNANNMKSSYGGKAPVMYDTTIMDVGIYTSKCGVGSLKQMIFKGRHEGPFWMDKKEQIRTKYDIVVEGTTKKMKTKAIMVVELRNKGVDTTSKRFLKLELIQMYNANYIDTMSRHKISYQVGI